MSDYIRRVIESIRRHPGIRCAALTGSRAATRGADEHSDLDVLLVTDDVAGVRDVRGWLPEPERIAIAAVHLGRYYSVLLDDMFKVDLAVYSTEDPDAGWVVQDFKVIKGDPGFERRLAAASEATESSRAAHLNPDVSVDNVLLLLSTAAKRAARGEQLSAHALVAMASDMLICLARQQASIPSDADRLDPRRRLESDDPALARALKDALFAHPAQGIVRLASHVLERRDSLRPAQARVAERLSIA